MSLMHFMWAWFTVYSGKDWLHSTEAVIPTRATSS